jgi:hypothetical protein
MSLAAVAQALQQAEQQLEPELDEPHAYHDESLHQLPNHPAL